MQSWTLKKAFKPVLLMALAAAVLLCPIFSSNSVALAAGGLELGTSYPGVMVKAGENVEFALELDNTGAVPQNAQLSIQSIPDGWEGYFQGNGQVISRAYVKSGATTKVNFNVKVPEDAQEGDYNITLLADAGNGASQTLVLTLTVSSLEVAQGQFISQYPELQGADTTTFSYNLNLVNNGGSDQSYSLASQSPDGWQVSFAPSDGSSNIASLSVASGQTEGLTAKITPPSGVAAGTYKITCTATSATEALSTDLSVIITGTYGLKLSTSSGLLNMDAYAGTETPIVLTITNSGSADLSNITLTSTQASSWSVRFSESSIDSLAAGETKEVTAYIKPGTNVITGDYATTIKAASKQTSSQADIRVAIKTPTAWGIVGIIIIAALVILLFWIFKKFGRR